MQTQTIESLLEVERKTTIAWGPSLSVLYSNRCLDWRVDSEWPQVRVSICLGRRLALEVVVKVFQWVFYVQTF